MHRAQCVYDIGCHNRTFLNIVLLLFQRRVGIRTPRARVALPWTLAFRALRHFARSYGGRVTCRTSYWRAWSRGAEGRCHDRKLLGLLVLICRMLNKSPSLLTSFPLKRCWLDVEDKRRQYESRWMTTSDSPCLDSFRVSAILQGVCVSTAAKFTSLRPQPS